MNVTVDSEGMAEFFSALDGGMRSATGAAAAVYQTELKRIMQRNRGGLPSGPGEPPAVQTGRLSQSIAYNIVAPNRAEVGTNVPYGKWLEFGANIVAKEKMLTVPLTKEAVLLRRRNTSLKSVKDLVFLKLKTGAFLVKQIGKGKNSRLEFMFALMSSVKLSPRPWLRPIANDSRVAAKANRAAAKELERAIASAKSGAISAAKAGGP